MGFIQTNDLYQKVQYVNWFI